MKSLSARSWYLICVLGIACVAAVFTFANDFIAPLLFNSRVERLHETGLPRASVTNGCVYCRMKADDFWLPLPAGFRAKHPVVTDGGCDWVDGSVETRFEGSDVRTPIQYEAWLSHRLPPGANVTAYSIPSGLLIKFHYFGDK